MSKARRERKAAFKASIIWKQQKRITFFALPFTFTKYTLTNDRFIIKSGVLNIKEDEVRLYRIMDISLKRSFVQRIFGLGTIHVCSADKTMGDFDIVNVKHPSDFREILSGAVEKERIEKRVSNREFLTHDDEFDEEPNPDFHGKDSVHGHIPCDNKSEDKFKK